MIILFTAAMLSCTPADGYETVSAHLEAIREADQADRRNRIDGLQMRENDRARRALVDAYMDEACLDTGRDHHNAALIHQHGGAPEDYREAWRLAVRAVELGDESAAWLIPRAIDRYFMATGYKQLYATNLRGELRDPDAGPDGGFGMCLWPVAGAVSDAEREALGVRTVQEQLAWAAEMNDQSEGQVCDVDAEDPPRGEFPGYW